MKIVVITGVSSGIGRATAADLVAHGYDVFGSVRSATDAERVRTELGSHFFPLLFDVTDSAAIHQAVSQVQSQAGDCGILGLINNAGISVPGPLMHLPLEELRRQFEVNLFGLMNVTQAFLPLLGARKNSPHLPGRIINISSISGRITYPFMGAYAAVKHALEAVSDALRRELMIYGIDVIAIEPGTVQTPITKKFEDQLQGFTHTDYAPIMESMKKELNERRKSSLPVEKVSRTIRRALEAKRPKARYCLPRKRLSGWLLPRWLPDRLLDRMLAKRLKLK